MSPNPLEWYNFIFVGPGILALIYFIVAFFTGFESEGFDVDGDGEVDSADGDGAELGSGFVYSLLAIDDRRLTMLGFAMLFLCWGLIGYFANISVVKNFWGVFKVPAFIGNCIFTALVSIVFVRKLMPVASRFLAPQDEPPVTTESLIGRRATVSTVLELGRPGFIVIPTTGGSFAKEMAILVNYEGEVLKEGEEVVVVGYKNGKYECTPVANLSNDVVEL